MASEEMLRLKEEVGLLQEENKTLTRSLQKASRRVS
eukprot:CAMPEP_0197669434 /NCGR_PEP_ID=MMETSP1338-20131121/71950_1 /TAXON_ID=43686 ORGANISM="Pelagodinium beii, Strain RCC1491" /NCGR_SAMPLE_ID=MMETSP1338 /ASSEMBLY_ACC=CAM_ASM_000754 /LENGTH=35 /DNA_ID= /DNA_START= /DNA_END= /DNA_ORIENTATION=